MYTHTDIYTHIFISICLYLVPKSSIRRRDCRRFGDDQEGSPVEPTEGREERAVKADTEDQG